MKIVALGAAPAGLVLVALLISTGPGLAQDEDRPDGQGLWRSCSSCHCVPDMRIPEDGAWLKLNETTTCISGDDDTPEIRGALIAYLSAKTTIRPLLLDGTHPAPASERCGRVRVPPTAGSAYLKADRDSVRAGSPPKIRLHWEAAEKGGTLEVPEGDYRVISYAFYRKDEQGRLWVASGSSAEGCLELSISREAEVELALRPEIQAHLECDEDEYGFEFGFHMTNGQDQRMSLSRDGRLVNPSWVVSDGKGERIDDGDFEVT